MIRLGLLGCAEIARRRVLPAVSRTAGITIRAVAARDPAIARSVAAAWGAQAVEDYRALLARPDIDAVYLPLPAALHGRWIRAALLAGKHVLAEKPLTTSLEETEELVSLARSSGLVLQENYMFLQHGQHRAVRRLLADGAVGQPRSLSAAFTIPPRPPGDIRYRADLGGGALFDVGGYPVRAAQLLLGAPLEVVGAALRHDRALGVDIGGSVLLSGPGGVTAQLVFGMDHFYTSRYEVLGSSGRLRLDHAFTPPADHAPTVRLTRADGAEELALEPEDQCAGAVAAFAAAVRERARPDEAIVRQAALIDEIRRSAGPQRR
ncbi:Gfo/Idh/MocA family protein [Streptomyces sp. TP-A0874]|uniref:Gfo/Idh/MocA family protein n=1 Tax=Streptomyces sp. TP-A0874 TaxID=549819 RepID=UPI000ACA3F4B|nr:Gfo/Idh/MocA family oxidoreductase [Streptomyces sp. TP-A0874]